MLRYQFPAFDKVAQLRSQTNYADSTVNKGQHDKCTVKLPNKTTYNSGHNFNTPAFTPTGIDGWRGSQGIETAAPEMAL